VSHLSSKKRAIGGVQKAIVGKCDEALDSLSGRAVSPEDIHAARKALKKARAWLRLLRTGTGQGRISRAKPCAAGRGSFLE
jgi:hypothetical protein